MKTKLFNVKAKRRNVEIILAPIFFLFKVASTAYSIPSLFGILVYRESTSMELISMLLIFRLKSVKSLTNDLSSFTCGCNWLSMYFKIFVVWQSIELTIDLPGFLSLWTLGNILNCSVFAFDLNESFATFSFKRCNDFSLLIVLFTFIRLISVLGIVNFCRNLIVD